MKPKRMYAWRDRRMEYAEVIGCYRDVPDDTPVRTVLVVSLDSESVDALREKIAEEAAVQIATAYTRGQYGTAVTSEPRQDYHLADTILAKLGIRRPSRSSGTGRGAGEKI